MDENGEILLLHASKNNARPLVLPCALYTLHQITVCLVLILNRLKLGVRLYVRPFLTRRARFLGQSNILAIFVFFISVDRSNGLKTRKIL